MASVPVLLVVFLIACVVGVYFLTRGPAKRAQGNRAGIAVARVGLVLGTVAAALTVLAALISFTTLLRGTLFDGPMALVTFLAIPLALAGAVCGAFGLRSALKAQAAFGLGISLLCIVAWFVMEYFGQQQQY